MINAYSKVCEMFDISFEISLPAVDADHITFPSIQLKDYISNPALIRTVFDSTDLTKVAFSAAQWEVFFRDMESNLIQLCSILEKHGYAFYEQIYNLCAVKGRFTRCLSSYREKLAVYNSSGKTGSLYIYSQYPFVFEEICKQVRSSAEKCNFAAEPPRTEKDLFNLMNKVNFFRRLAYHDIRIGDNAFLLNNNKYLVNDFGKYKSGLTFVVSEANMMYYDYKEDTALKQQFNVIWDGTPSFMFGRFWVSQKGTKCFEVTSRANATHILTKLSWGGAFCKSRGRTKLPNALYVRDASSNGGGAGNTYFVSDINNFVSSVSIDDI